MSLTLDHLHFAKEIGQNNSLQGVPILGVMPELRRDPLGFLRRILKEHGSLVRMKIGGETVIMAGHPDAVRHVLVTNSRNYSKTKFVEKLKPILGNGLATSNGDIWQASRDVIQPRLTAGFVKRVLPEIDQVIQNAIKPWGNGQFDIGAESCALTLKVITRTMFGARADDAALRIVDMVNDQQAYLSKYIWAIYDFQKLFRLKTYRRFARSVVDLRDMMTEWIDERRTGQDYRDDLLQGLIEAVDANGQPFSMQQIMDDVMTVYMAGHDTTGNTLAFFWSYLAANPALQAEIRDEAFRHVPLDATPTHEQLSKLEVTHAVIKEVMRLHPSSWWFARTAAEDDHFCGQDIKAGDTIMVAPYVVHRNPDYWPNADEFEPYRFLGRPPENRFAFIPFGAGPRICPGSHFATDEMLLTVARVLHRYELQTVEPLEVEAMVNLKTRNGLQMIAKPIPRVVTVSGVEPGENAFVDHLLCMRREIFVDRLGWKLHVDEKGREVDQFDTRDAEYSAVVHQGKVMAYGRLLPTDKPNLLFDVYGFLMDGDIKLERSPLVWEGTRLGTALDIPAEERSHWLSFLVMDAIRRARAKGVNYLCSVSDIGMEKVLKRIGVSVERLGGLKTDRHGVEALALRINCRANISTVAGKCPVNHGAMDQRPASIEQADDRIREYAA